MQIIDKHPYSQHFENSKKRMNPITLALPARGTQIQTNKQTISKKCTFKFRDKCALVKHLENHIRED